jgi:sodium transport system permease protein
MNMFNQEGESAWNLWVPALAQTTLMNRVLKNAPITALDVAPSLVICILLTAAALTFVSRQLTRRAAQ